MTATPRIGFLPLSRVMLLAAGGICLAAVLIANLSPSTATRSRGNDPAIPAAQARDELPPTATIVPSPVIGPAVDFVGTGDGTGMWTR